ncbi:Zn-dependent exopeptidase [Mycena belliarum]|uniref:Zn-dependent exopeptidase n=1 Tax=Mycena belliarum TaxID=1033014 RepID=A0AAD6UEG8_9AGAR|nr:Zn-dependent exopeptidase [Mycena belliae]
MHAGMRIAEIQRSSLHTRRRKHTSFGAKRRRKLFLSVPDQESAIAASRLFATKPHLAGSEGDLQTAKDFANVLQTAFGIDSSTVPIYEAGSADSQDATNSIPKTKVPKTWIDVYYPVMNTPLDRTLQVVGSDGEVVWEAELEEVADDTDPEAGKYYDAVPTFHGLSAPGDVQGKLIYADYGRKEDYDALVEKGVNLTGAIVICRYGAIFRGLKVKGAQELGAAGVLIYRDPTTPGFPSYENSTRTTGENIPKIPSLPISAANAEKLFSMVGEDGTEVRLVNHVDTKVTPIWNTMGVIPGFITDEVVVIGNHRDGDLGMISFNREQSMSHVIRKVMGAADPSSGTVSVHEAVRGLGALMQKGWKPLRTILICSWDAEEYGLIGSTEWVEDFPEFIGKHVVTYLNLDSSVSGSRLHAAASPSLSHFLREAALDIPHPTSPGRTLWDARNDMGPYGGNAVDAESIAVRQSMNSFTDTVGVSPLGSGSDYTAFLQMIGVASSDAGFGGSGQDAIYHYHSVFDSEYWQETFADPGFHRHVAVAKHIGLEIVRLSSAIVLPLNTTHYTYELENYLNGIQGIAFDSAVDVDLSPLRKSIVALQAASHSLDFEKDSAEKDLRKMIRKWMKRQFKLRRKLRKVYCRLRKIFGHPCNGDDFEEHPCTGKFSSMPDAAPSSKFRVGRLPAFLDEQQGLGRDVLYGLAVHAGFDGDAFSALPKFPLARFKKAVRRVRAVNKKLVGFEKGFISKDGIPDREWYKHLAIAPGKWLGYGATPMPALSEAIQFEKNATLAQYEVKRLTDLIDKLADEIRVHA